MARTTQGVHITHGGSNNASIYNIAPAFNASNTYEVGDIVTYSSKCYRCRVAITTPASWNSAKWTEISNKSIEIKDFPDITKFYQKERLETTTLSDTYHQYLDTLKIPFEDIPFTMNYDADLYDVLQQNQVESQWQLSVGGSQAKEFRFQGTPRMELIGAGVDEVLEMRLTFKIIGNITMVNE